MKIKICGVTTIDDALMAAEEGADMIGLIFAPSPRQIEAVTARSIVDRLPAGVETVGVFKDQPLDEVRATAAASGVAIVQLHGEEDPAYARAVGRPVIKAFTGKPREDYDVHAILIESPDGDAASDGRRLMIAGGLDPDRASIVARSIRPWGLDACRTTERSPGRKDRSRVREFIRAIREAAP